MASWVKAELLHTFPAHTSDVNGVAFQGNRTLATCSGDKSIRLFDVSTHAELKHSPLRGHTYYVNCVTFSPFGTLLASCSTDGKAILWDANTGAKLASFQHNNHGGLRVCCFSPNSVLFVTGGDDETITVWNVADKKQMQVLDGHEAAITGLAFTPDSIYFVSGSNAGDLRMWDARYGHSRSLVTVKEAHDLGVMSVAFSPTHGVVPPHAPADGSLASGRTLNVTTFKMASCGNDQLVKLWHVDTTPKCSIKLQRELSGHAGSAMCVCFSYDGQLLASGAGDHSVIIWNPNTGEMLTRMLEHTRYVTSCAFSSDGQYLASGSNDRTVLLWALSSNVSQQQVSSVLQSSAVEQPSVPAFLKQQFKLLCEWSVGEVCTWLIQLELPQYVETFQKNAIDGNELLAMTDESLSKHLGVGTLGHRNKMIRSRDKLKHNPYGADRKDNSAPGEFLCPITHEVMTDPVIASDGYSYEREAIQAWLDAGRLTSPMSNAPLPNSDLTPNRMLKMLIQRHLNS